MGAAGTNILFIEYIRQYFEFCYTDSQYIKLHSYVYHITTSYIIGIHEYIQDMKVVTKIYLYNYINLYVQHDYVVSFNCTFNKFLESLIVAATN